MQNLISILLLLVLAITGVTQTYINKQQDVSDVSGRIIRYHKDVFTLYGLKGEGYLKKKVPVYSPVYINRLDYEILLTEKEKGRN